MIKKNSIFLKPEINRNPAEGFLVGLAVGDSIGQCFAKFAMTAVPECDTEEIEDISVLPDCWAKQVFPQEFLYRSFIKVSQFPRLPYHRTCRSWRPGL